MTLILTYIYISKSINVVHPRINNPQSHQKSVLGLPSLNGRFILGFPAQFSLYHDLIMYPHFSELSAYLSLLSDSDYTHLILDHIIPHYSDYIHIQSLYIYIYIWQYITIMEDKNNWPKFLI